MTASLRILSSKDDSNTWESFTGCELKLESVHQESPRSDIFRKRVTKPLLKQKHRQKSPAFGPEFFYASRAGLRANFHIIVQTHRACFTRYFYILDIHQLVMKKNCRSGGNHESVQLDGDLSQRS